MKEPHDDDEDSVTSIMSTSTADYEEDELIKEVQVVRRSSSTDRAVHFDESRNMIHTLNEQPEETQDSWYTGQDYKCFKADRSRQVKTFSMSEDAKGPLSMPKMMKEIYDTSSEAGILVGDAISELQDDEVDFLKYLYGSKDRADMIGLEIFISKAVNNVTGMRRKELQDVAYETQNTYGPRLVHCDSAKEELRASCHEITHRYQLFAQYIAIAQRFSLEQEED